MVEAANHTRLSCAGSIIITGPEARLVEDATADFLRNHAPRVKTGKGVRSGGACVTEYSRFPRCRPRNSQIIERHRWTFDRRHG